MPDTPSQRMNLATYMSEHGSVNLTSVAKESASATLADVRKSVQELTEKGQHEEALEYVLSALSTVLEQSTALQLLVSALRRQNSGKRSERTNGEQLRLLLQEYEKLAPKEEERDPDAEAREDAQLTEEIKAAEAEQRAAANENTKEEKLPGWRVSDAVEREVKKSELPESERQCAGCGQVMNQIGEDTKSTLKLIPARLVVVEQRRAKYACGSCKVGVKAAPAPEEPVGSRCSADASLLAHVAVSKYVDHTPLNRLHRIYARSGATVPVSTLAGWIATTADLISPVAAAIADLVRESLVVNTDATGLKVLDHKDPENITRGTVWGYVGGNNVVYLYAPTGAGESGPWKFLAGRTGYIQADASATFDRLFNGQVTSAVEVGCWAHARRNFHDLKDTDCRVAYELQLIGRLYRIEHLADARGLSSHERAMLRRERSQPVLDKLKRTLLASLPNEPPRSELAKAARYVLNHWVALTRFVEDGRLSLDNNLCERQLRAIAVGRRNYLFAGSHEAAERATVLYTVLQSAVLHGISPLAYLTDVLRQLAMGTPAHELVPSRWQEQQPTG